MMEEGDILAHPFTRHPGGFISAVTGEIHPAVRKAIGGQLHGDAAHQAWGVMDVLAVTDFPDVRMKCVIQSNHCGNLLILPREGGYLVRYYV